jgi:hypothetical protein
MLFQRSLEPHPAPQPGGAGADQLSRGDGRTHRLPEAKLAQHARSGLENDEHRDDCYVVAKKDKFKSEEHC